MRQDEMRRLTQSLPTKAEKIRALGRAGVSPADIGRFLGIRYQHAYNVLKRGAISPSGAVRDTEGSVTATTPAKSVLDEAGRIFLPDRILEAWGVSPGENLLVRLEGQELRVVTRRDGLRLARDILRKYPSMDESLADELIEERRREAERGDG